MEQLICWRLNPAVQDQRVLADKAVMRGNGNLHVVYRSKNGQLHGWDFEVPFSQYAQLQQEYGNEARLDLALMPTALELELLEDGTLSLKGGIAAQYLITDKEPVTLIEDAYSPERELIVRQENLTPPVILENRKENIFGEQTLPIRANVPVDVQFLPDFPRRKSVDGGMELEYPGQFQVLYYAEDGHLQAANARWEGTQNLPAGESSGISAVPLGTEAQAVAGSTGLYMKVEIPVALTADTLQPIPMVTGIELGSERKADPGRPSLILRRAGQDRLWDIAKATGSTMDKIRRVNGLSGEPLPDQMLLIPVQ